MSPRGYYATETQSHRVFL